MTRRRPLAPLLLPLCSLLTVPAVVSASTNVFVQDPSTSEIYALTDTVAALVNPTTPLAATGLGLDSRGDLLLATETHGGYIVRLDPATEELTVVADTLGAQTVAVDVYQDATGDIYVLGETHEAASGRAQPKLAVLRGGEMPPELVWEFMDSDRVSDMMVYPWGDRRGNVIVLSSSPGYLAELEWIEPNGFVESFRVSVPGNPTAFALTRAGDVIVLDYGTGMFVFEPPDAFVPFGSLTGPGLTDICVASDGTIYVSNDSLQVVHRFDNSGSPILPDLAGPLTEAGAIVAPLFTPTPVGTNVTVEPLEGIVAVFEEVALAGYTMAAATPSPLRISPLGNRLPDFALLPADPRQREGRADKFNYIALATNARHKNLIQVDVYEDGSRFFFASGIGDTFRDFTVTGSIEDARGTIPRFGDQIQPPGRLENPLDHLVEIVLVDDDRSAQTVVERKIARTDTAMSVPTKQFLATDLPYPGEGPWDGSGNDRGGAEPCPWGQIRRLRQYLARAVYEYRLGHPVAARNELEDLNAELRYVAGWCIPDSSDARFGNLVGEMLAHSKTLHWSIGEAGTGVDTGGAPVAPRLALAVPAGPASGQCAFSMSGAEGTDVVLSVYNAAGKLVADVFDGVLDGDIVTVAWDGRDQLGKPVSSGVYFARLRSDNDDATSKVVLIR